MVLKAQNFQFSTNVALAYNVIGLGEVAEHKTSIEVQTFKFR